LLVTRDAIGALVARPENCTAPTLVDDLNRMLDNLPGTRVGLRDSRPYRLETSVA